MSRRSNFIDGNDNFREQNLRFVRNELEDNFNQFFSGAGPGAAPAIGGAPAGNGAPPRDSIVVQPTPDTELRRNVELADRRQYMRQLGVSRKQANLMAAASMNVPSFNMREIQRKRFRMSVEFGDSRQAEVDVQIVREINNLIEAREQRLQDRPRTPPPPCNINWNASRESTPNLRDIPRQREASPENYGLVRRTDDNFHVIQPHSSKGNDYLRQVERNDSIRQVERYDNFRGVERNDSIRQVERNDYFGQVERNDDFRGVERNDKVRGQRLQSIGRNDNLLQFEQHDNVREQRQSVGRNDNFHGLQRNDDFRQVDRNENFRQVERNHNFGRNDNFRQVEPNDNFRQVGRNNQFHGTETIDNFRGAEQNDHFRGDDMRQVGRNDNFRQATQNDNFRDDRQNYDRQDSFRHNIEQNDILRSQNFEQNDNLYRGQNFERFDNFRGENERFGDQQRNYNFREMEHFDNNSRFVDIQRNQNLDNIGFDQRNFDRDPNFGLDRRQASQENRSIDNLRGNFDRNCENLNSNDYDRNNRDFRSVPMHLQDKNSRGTSRENTRDDFRYANDMNDFSNNRNSNRSNRFDDNFGDQQTNFGPRGPNLDGNNERFYNNARDNDNSFRRSEFPEFNPGPSFDDRYCEQQRNDFGLPCEQSNFNINPHNNDYNAVLDNDGRLDNDFHGRSFRNLRDSDDFQSGPLIMNNDGNRMNWNDDRRNDDFLVDNRYINPGREPVQNQPFRNRNLQKPMNQTRSKSNFLERTTQANRNERINSNNNNNRGPAAKFSKQNSQQPPNRTVNAASKKPATATSTVVNDLAKRGNSQDSHSSKPSTDQPLVTEPTATTSSQANIINTKAPIKRQGLLPNPAAAARARLGQKRDAESVNTEQPTKKQKLAARKYVFLVGGFKLPYINKNLKELPQPEEKSYAVTFFEQTPIYNTCIYAQDNDGAGVIIDTDDDDGDDNSDDDQDGPCPNMQPVSMGKRKLAAIRKRIDKTWTKVYRLNNYKCWHTWWKAFKWCELEMNKKLEKFGNLNIKSKFLPSYPKKSTKQVIDMVMKSAHFALQENTRKHFRDSKTLYVLMNDTFLENLRYPVIEQLQNMIRGIPNHMWVYKMRSMVYLWAEYFKIASPKNGNPRDFVAIQAKWRSPVFHWLCKQSFDELKAISAIEWREHNEVFPSLESRPF